MRHPYQCLAVASTGAGEKNDLLLAACGFEIYVYKIDSGELVAVWPERVKEDEEEDGSSPDIITISDNADTRPAKRRRKAKAKDSTASEPALTKLIATKDGRHLVATTGEDKSVLVFHVEPNGKLELLSRRQMTKRPCAITLTGEDDCILVGDKFGDVYALPLLPSTTGTAQRATEIPAAPKITAQPHKPAASELTVHTVRNRKVLEAQLKAGPVEPKDKDTMHFEHELLLGHVSMLTDIATIAVKQTHQNGAQHVSTRNYILTGDRDEHIRVSRGRPQAWIIENYCFGHTQFVSKLCLPYQDILVSGGGDDHLFVWDWRQGKLLGKLDLRQAIASYWESQPVRMRKTKKDVLQQANDEALALQDSIEAAQGVGPGDEPEELQKEDDIQERIAVSGLWSGPSHVEGSKVHVYCACEAVPAIFQYTIATTPDVLTNDVPKPKVLPLTGNPLDLAFVSGTILISTDNVHEPATRDSPRRLPETIARIQSFQMNGAGTKEFEANGSIAALVNALNDISNGTEVAEEKASLKSLQELIYGYENLRKRGNEDT